MPENETQTMSIAETTAAAEPAPEAALDRAAPEAMPANIKSTQPGGGLVYSIELAWGGWRRCCLKFFNRQYVRRMRELRRGEPTGVPYEVLDPRDLKFFRNQTDCHWAKDDDPFAWRDRLPFARWGLAELQLFGWPLLAVTVGLIAAGWWILAPLAAIPLFLVVYFFRDPPRRVPQEPGLLVSPADGKVVEITPLDEHEHVDGPCVRIAIFLSLLNVHVNRAPCEARVLRLRYAPGRFISALDPDCALHNENMWIGLEDESPRHRRFAMRQVAGAVARRIVCDLKPGQTIARGEKFGMIKFGSRTELILPADGLEVKVQVGQMIHGGCDVIARYAD
jgi:phosphatidylserine decarboxylase